MGIRRGIVALGVLASVWWGCAANASSECSPLPAASSPGFLEHLTAFMNGAQRRGRGEGAVPNAHGAAVGLDGDDQGLRRCMGRMVLGGPRLSEPPGSEQASRTSARRFVRRAAADF